MTDDSYVGHTADAHLDRVSTPVDDNSPPDYTAMMQDIDQLDEIMAGIEYSDHTHTHDNNTVDSDVRHMADVHLDRVPTTMDDNRPLDYAAMMQDIDDLDQILAGMQYTNHTNDRDAADCRVCSSKPCSSSDRCTCRTCTNCGVPSSGSICTRCHSLPRLSLIHI